VAEFDENLALRLGATISVSVLEPTTSSAPDPRVLLNDLANRLDGQPLSAFDRVHTYDTYDGPNSAEGPDWYAIHLGTSCAVNCIEMTMGFPYRNGGWWRSLCVETQAEPGGEWRPVANLRITPAYDFEDARGERRPYETYAITFDDARACAVRVIGQPGGVARYTSLARLAVYHRDLSRWNPASLPKPPLPNAFRLMSANLIWDLSESLVNLTGLTIEFPLMEFYLDAPRFLRLWLRTGRNFQGEFDLWFLLGNHFGWREWKRMYYAEERAQALPDQPHVQARFHHTLATAAAPIIVEGEHIGTLVTHPPVIVEGDLDWPWHQQFCRRHGIDCDAYQSAAARSPRMSLARLESVADLMGLIANRVANLKHRYLQLQEQMDQQRASASAPPDRDQLVRQAIDYMQANLEASITVAQVAKSVALSESYFCTLFAEATGRTPRDYLIDLRLERAKEYLAHTRMSVQGVCTRLGYEASYFSRLFKQRIGITPSEYARRTSGR
jgi:AraC-like DNA-binding protein